jgi:predicted transcriptional regulator
MAVQEDGRVNLPASSLITIGISKTPAAILSALFLHDGQTSAELVQSTGLPKGTVVSGLRYWRFEGWVTSQEGVVSLGGRTPHVWKLSFSKEEVIHRLQNIVGKGQFELEDTIRGLNRWIVQHDGEI